MLDLPFKEMAGKGLSLKSRILLSGGKRNIGEVQKGEGRGVGVL